MIKKSHLSFTINITKQSHDWGSAGYTLVEMLLYMGLLAIFLIVQTDLISTVLETTRRTEATSSVDQDGRFLLARLHYDLLRATTISVPANPGNSDNTLTVVIDGINHIYALNGGTLTLTNNLGTDNLSSNQTTISALSFQKLGSASRPTVKIQFTITSVTSSQSGPEGQTFTTTVGPR